MTKLAPDVSPEDTGAQMIKGRPKKTIKGIPWQSSG